VTATRQQPDPFIRDFLVARPAPDGVAADGAPVAGRFFFAQDTGDGYLSDGASWIAVSKVAPGGPGNVLDYDTANLTQFASTQLAESWSLTFDNTRTRHGAGFSGRFQLRHNDIPLGDGHERAEILGPSFVEGDDKWYGWSTWFPDAVSPDPTLNPTDTSSTSVTNIFTQIHENRGPTSSLPTAAVPPIRVSVNTNLYTYPFHWTMNVAGGPLDSSNFPVSGVAAYDLGTVLYNQWVDFIMHVKHSSDASVGKFEMWVNGSRPASIPSTVTCATLYPGRNNYFKQGYYRTNQALTSDIWHDETRIGASYAEVDPST
jgi:hypothetical protein